MKSNKRAKQCPICKAEFLVKLSHFERRVYCSRKCMAGGYSSRLTGDNNPNAGFLRRVKPRNCSICLTPFKSYSTRKTCGNNICIQQQIEKSKAVTFSKRCPICGSLFRSGKKACSKACRKLLRGMAVKRKFKSKKFEKCRVRICVICNREFRRYYAKKTCSVICLRTHRSVMQKGENSHLWQGGKTSASSLIRGSLSYAIWRDFIYSRDDYTCAICLKRGGRLAAHHIKKFSKYPELRLEVNNGITLCWECHTKIRGREEILESDFTKKVEAKLSQQNSNESKQSI